MVFVNQVIIQFFCTFFRQFCSKTISFLQPISSANPNLFWLFHTFWINQILIFLYVIDPPLKFHCNSYSNLNFENGAIFGIFVKILPRLTLTCTCSYLNWSNLSIDLSTCCLSFCQSVSLSIYLFVYLSIYLCICLYFCLHSFPELFLLTTISFPQPISLATPNLFWLFPSFWNKQIFILLCKIDPHQNFIIMQIKLEFWKSDNILFIYFIFYLYF